MKSILISLFVVSSLAGCNSTEATSTTETSTPQIKEQKQMERVLMQGTVRFMNLEGGFYGIITKDGRRLLPMNLEKELRQDGAIIEFSGDVVKDVMTIQQWGTPFKLEDVVLIKPGKKVMNKDF